LSIAVFLDRDGVINENRDDYVKTWEEVVFLPGVIDALARLACTPFHIVIVTNQSPIGRGILTEEEVKAINRRLVAEIESHGGRVDGVYYCPHHPDDRCECRKPKPGLLYQAARDLELDLTHSYLIGDAVSDIKAALAVGCYPILVTSGRGQRQMLLLQQERDEQISVVQDLAEAVNLILRGENRTRSVAGSEATQSERATLGECHGPGEKRCIP